MKEIKHTCLIQEFDNISELEPIERQLLEAAANIRDKAYAPYSKFYVGAAVNSKMVLWFLAATRKMLPIPLDYVLSGLRCLLRMPIIRAKRLYVLLFLPVPVNLILMNLFTLVGRAGK